MVNNNSKRQQRIKFPLSLVPFIIVIIVVGVWLVVANYFIAALIMTASSIRPLNDTIQLTQNMFKSPPGSYATQLLVPYVPPFILFTADVAILLVYVELLLRLNQLWNWLTKPPTENSELRILPDTDNT